MLKFNPLEHQVCFSYPQRLFASDWAVHIPFAMFLISALRPKILIELGTVDGVSYCAFCQAIKELEIDTRCYAVGVWQELTKQKVPIETENYKELKSYHDSLYGNFSTIIENTSDELALNIKNGSVDLLHIDGTQIYKKIKHKFDTWLPKMSNRGIILFHGINKSEQNFAVSKLWRELRQRYPHFEFAQENGLGLISIGVELPSIIQELLTAVVEDQAVLRNYFAGLGNNLQVHQKNEQQINKLFVSTAAQHQTIIALSEELTAKETYLNTILNTRSWRLINRLGRIKIRYVEPVYEKLFQVLRKSNRKTNPGSNQNPEMKEGADLLAAKDCWIDPFKKSLILLPEPDRRQLLEIIENEDPAPLHKPDIICFSIVDWDYAYQRPQQIMSQFALHGHRVFYIRLKSVLKENSNPRFALNEIKKNIYEVTLAATRIPRINQEIINSFNLDSFLDSLNDLRNACFIDEAIAYVMTPTWKDAAFAARDTWNWRIIYDCMDEWDGFPGTASTVVKSENSLVNECYLLVVTAKTLQEKWSKQREGSTVLVRNGVDFEYYQNNCHSNSLLENNNQTLIGYFGAIADWFDLELMIYAAKQRPHYSFILLGGIFNVDISKLIELPNVKLLGHQPYATMPQYLYHFDVCLIPFKLNSITHATDPVKLYEYLSVGKPVVSTALEELIPFKEYLYIAQNREDFLNKIDLAVNEKDEELKLRRSEFAKNNTWKTRYETIITAFSGIIPQASIIIVTYNNLALNKLCLESVVRNTDYLSCEIIVVDNNSSDGTMAYLSQFASQHQNIRLILNSENLGFAKANNQGLRISTGKKIVLLNNDTVVSPGWLSRLLKHLDNPQVGMVGPVTNFVGNEAKLDVSYTTWSEMEKFSLENAQRNNGKTSDIFMLAMFCVAFRREIYESIGNLDEQFGIGMFEDDDYSHRIKLAGYRLVCAMDVFVHHFGQSAFKKLIQTGEYEKLFQKNRYRFESKWGIKWIPHKNKSLL